MNTTPPEAPPPPSDAGAPAAGGPRVTRDEVRDLGRLRRSISDRKVAGVAGGLGRHLDVDPLVLRVAFVVLVFFGGAGLILYGACWLLVPSDNDPQATINLDDRTRSIVLVGVGVLAAIALIGDSWGAFWFPWPLAVVALVALWILTRNKPAPQPPQAYYGPVPPVAPDQTTPYPASAYAAPTYTAPVYTGPATAPTYTAPTYTAPTYTAPGYEAPISTAPGYEAPAYTAAPPYYPPVQPVPQRVPNPRRRGPILFWFTLALIALAEGLLGMIDLAGANVAGPAYPALAVAICGVMLVIGAFFGRAGGIVLVGLIATVVLAGATAADQWDGDTVDARPLTAAGVESDYQVDAGEIVLDLRDVADLTALDGRTIAVRGDVGHLEVILPPGLGARVNASVDGPGNIQVFDRENGGINTTMTAFEGSVSDPRITINADLGVGAIEVHHR
nr:PspC domain-containing protein [Nocardioides sp. URHA0020]